MAENIQDILNSDEGKKLFSELVEKEITDKGYKKPEDVDGLVKKNRELLAKIAEKNEKNKKNDEKLLTILEKYAILDIDELDDVLSSSSKTAKGKPDETERALRKFEREAATERQRAEDAIKQLTQIKNQFHNAEKSKAILTALGNAGVDDVYSDVLVSHFDRLVKVEEDEDGKISLIADDGAQGTPFSDYFQNWTKSEKAKHYIKATVSSGAGSTPTGRHSPKMTLEQIGALSDPREINKALKDNGYA